MKECLKCKAAIGAEDKAYWQCPKCGNKHVFPIQNLIKLPALVQKDGVTPVVKCKKCDAGLEEESKIKWKCSICGIVITDTVKHFKEDEKQRVTVQSKDKELNLIDITRECNYIRKIFVDFKNNYIPLTNMRVDVEKILQLKNIVSEKVSSLSSDVQKEVKGKFAESVCCGLCENNNIDVIHFEDVKKICDIIEINKITKKSISNITQIVYELVESKTGASGLTALSWLIYELLNCSSEEDIKLLEATLKKPDAFGKTRKLVVMEVVEKLKNKPMHMSEVFDGKVNDKNISNDSIGKLQDYRKNPISERDIILNRLKKDKMTEIKGKIGTIIWIIVWTGIMIWAFRVSKNGSLGMLILVAFFFVIVAWWILYETRGSIKNLERKIKIASRSVEEYKEEVEFEQHMWEKTKKVERERKQNELQQEYESALRSQQSDAPWDTKYFTSPCPHCGHYKARYIKWEDKRNSIYFWGRLSGKIGKNYICDNCKWTWE